MTNKMKCDDCYATIDLGDTYYSYDNNVYCESCIDDVLYGIKRDGERVNEPDYDDIRNDIIMKEEEK